MLQVCQELIHSFLWLKVAFCKLVKSHELIHSICSKQGMFNLCNIASLLFWQLLLMHLELHLSVTVAVPIPLCLFHKVHKSVPGLPTTLLCQNAAAMNFANQFLNDDKACACQYECFLFLVSFPFPPSLSFLLSFLQVLTDSVRIRHLIHLEKNDTF